MSHGATRAGIDVAFAIEQDVHAANTYVQNHPDTELCNDDIRKFSSQRIKRIPRGKNGTVVFGGPPCQGFSYSNTRTRHVENENNWLFEEFVRFVRVWEPNYFVADCSQGLVKYTTTATWMSDQPVADCSQGLVKYTISPAQGEFLTVADCSQGLVKYTSFHLNY